MSPHTCYIFENLFALPNGARTDMGNYGPRAKSGLPVLLFWPAGTYGNLHSHHEFSGRPFFRLEITNGSDFPKKKPQRCIIEMKNEVKTFDFGDHIRTWTVISEKKEKKVFTLFSNQRATRGFNSFSKFGPSCEKFAHLCART